jgi:hypothetical protein
MKTLMTSAALAALIAIAPSYAQQADTPAEEPPAATEPAPTDELAPQEDMEAPADTAETPAEEEGTAVAAEDAEFLSQQEEGQLMISSWIGATVYSASDENIGDINDFVVGEDGTIAGVVLGVGGFLGMGEKNVAVPFDSIQASEQDGTLKLVVNLTKEQLDAAPAFMTLDEIEAQKQIESPPADPMAPAPAPAQ